MNAEIELGFTSKNDPMQPPLMTELTLIADPSSEAEMDGLPLPPMRLKWLIHYFRLGFASFVLISTLLGLVSCSQTKANWKPADQVVSAFLLKDVLAQNATLSEPEVTEAIAQGKAWSIPGQSGSLVLVDFQTPSLCGQLGCLYVGIWTRAKEPPQQVFSSYLNPTIPKGKTLFEVLQPDKTKTVQQKALPCLKVTQVDADATDGIRQVNFCFDGRQYRVVDGSLQAPSPSPKPTKQQAAEGVKL
jgi:hypothetical protein